MDKDESCKKYSYSCIFQCRFGDFYTIKADENIFAYTRSDLNERILVIINKSDSTQEIEIDIPSFYKVKKITNLISDECIDLTDNGLKLKVDRISYQIFELQ